MNADREQMRRREIRVLLNRLYLEGGHGWIERAVERLTIHMDAYAVELEQVERERDEWRIAAAKTKQDLVAAERERDEALGEATTARIGRHVCETDDGTWRPCPAHLCEGARLLTEGHHSYVEQVRRAEQAERERDEANGRNYRLEAKVYRTEARLAAVPALVEAARSVHESRSDLSLHDGSGTRAVGDYFVSRRALDALAAALAAVEQAQEQR